MYRISKIFFPFSEKVFIKFTDLKFIVKEEGYVF